MLFSISMPVYNAEKYLNKSIGSVIAQTEKDYELILVNDGSTDNSLSICKEWQRKYPDKIRVVDKENTGSLLTRRVCLHESLGKYLYIMDADDYLIDNNMLRIIRKKIEEQKCDLIIFNCSIGSNDTTYLKLPFINNKIYENEEKIIFYELLLTGGSLNQLWNKVFARELVDWKVDYSPFNNVTHATDAFQFIPICVNAKRIMYLDNIFYHYTLEENSQSIVHTFSNTIYDSYKERHKRLFDYSKSWNSIKNKEILIKNSFMSSVKQYFYRSLLIKTKNELFDLYKDISNDSYFRENYNLKGNTFFTKLVVFLLFHRKFYYLILINRFLCLGLSIYKNENKYNWFIKMKKILMNNTFFI